MKTKIFTLLMTLFAFAWSAKADEITSLKLTISHNGEPAFEQEFPATGWPEFVLDEQTTSIIISKVEVTTSGTVSDVTFLGTMYDASDGGPSEGDEWRSFPLQPKGNGKWELDLGEGQDLVDERWLTKPKTKTFEFYIQGTNGSGGQLFYNNGGANYKVTFSTGESTDWKIKFLDGITAGLTFSLDGEDRVYNFNGAGDRVPEDQLGQLSSLCIDQFALLFYKAEGVKTNDVSLQYRVYEEGQEPEGGWSRINATHLDQEGGNQMFCYTDIVGINVTNGLEPNRVYILEAHYQVVVDGEYIFLGKNKEGSKFRFTLMENMLQDEIYSVILTLKHNGGEPYEVYFEHENQPTLNLEGQTTSLKIMKAEVWTSEGVQSVNVVGTMYNTENGGPTGGNEWRSMPLSNADNGYWLLDFGKEGYEIVEDEWLNNNKSKTFQFYVTAVDRQGNGIVYDNEGQDYKVSFTTGGSSSTSPIKSFKITVNCDGEEFTESFPSEGWSQHYIEGQVSSIKVMRVEAETDESMSNLGFCWTIYDTADGWQHDNSAWGWQDLIGRGGGHWDYEWGKGLEFIESDWIFQNVTKTLEFFVSGEDSNGITHKYGNGINEQGYDNNYKVTFTTGIDPDGVHLIPASTANGTTYNLAGQRVGKDYKGIVVTGGRKVLVK